MSQKAGAQPLRIGILGAASIAPMALVAPAARVEDATVRAVAARDPARARAFARKHGIPVVHESYEDLLDDPEIDAIYNPLPNGLHREWSIAVLDAGKHLLCEKPFTSNAAEAEEVAKRAAASDRVVMEAFHYRYHPVALRVLEILRGGELGEIRHVEARMCIPLLKRSDIRYQLDLAGGANMDVGCYAIHMLRTFAGEEPEVLRAEARLASPGVDRWMRADFCLPSGGSGSMTCALLSARLLSIMARVSCQRGELRVFNPVAPQFYHHLKLKTADGTRTERLSRTPSYVYQLRAFVEAIRKGTPIPTGPSDAVANMRVVDAVYDAAGLPLRGLG